MQNLLASTNLCFGVVSIQVRRVKARLILAVFLYLIFIGWSTAETLWFVPPASNLTQQGFIRITNTTSVTTGVSLFGIDDAGRTSTGSASFTLLPFESKQFNSSDLEFGNPGKGLIGALGHGTGNWRLDLSASGPITATAMIRTTTGFLTSVQDPDPNKVEVSTLITVPMVNPGGNPNQVSILRFVNPNNTQATISIAAFDDSGVRHPAQGFLTLSLAPQQAVQLSSSDLEGGAVGKGLSGALGVGVGKWRIDISSNEPVKILNLLFDPNGFISELPSLGVTLTDAGFFSCTDLDGAMVFSQDDLPLFLGFFGNQLASNSINNTFGQYGSTYSATSIRNTFSNYGSQFSNFSAMNSFASNPPVIVKDGKKIGYLTVNSLINGVSLSTVDASCSFSSVVQRDPW